ncbi:hypothetical protein DFH06DRAFT_157714 [Mycena polygramma]|nr:hypothetical protein DFH06DRAFT_157714 [Mycena polygramma]
MFCSSCLRRPWRALLFSWVYDPSRSLVDSRSASGCGHPKSYGSQLWTFLWKLNTLIFFVHAFCKGKDIPQLSVTGGYRGNYYRLGRRAPPPAHLCTMNARGRVPTRL